MLSAPAKAGPKNSTINGRAKTNTGNADQDRAAQCQLDRAPGERGTGRPRWQRRDLRQGHPGH